MEERSVNETAKEARRGGAWGAHAEHVVEDGLVKVLATEKGVAVGCLHLEHLLADLQDGHVERAAAEVVYRDDAVLLVLPCTVPLRQTGILSERQVTKQVYRGVGDTVQQGTEAGRCAPGCECMKGSGTGRAPPCGESGDSRDPRSPWQHSQRAISWLMDICRDATGAQKRS